MLNRLRYHLPRVRNTFGKTLRLGRKRYKIKGYHANGLVRELDDEPHIIPVLKRTFGERSGAFLDVGANCGQTFLKVLAVEPGRHYYGFEPQLECCFYIEHFIRTNSLRSAHIIPIALSNANGIVELFWDQPSDVTASLLKSYAYDIDKDRPFSSWVPARRGDEVIRELGLSEIAIIKIDVEGFELEVLSGLSQTISEQRPVILFEVLTNYLWGELLEDKATCGAKQDRADALYSFLSEQNYSIYRIDTAGEEHPIHRFELDEKPVFPFTNEGRDYVARSNDI